MSKSFRVHGFHVHHQAPGALDQTLVYPWCYPNISSAIVPFSSCLQFFQALGVFPTSQFFASISQSIGASTLASVLPMNIQDWFPLGACSNSCPLSQWCHPTISSSVAPFSCLQSFPGSGSFPASPFFTSDGQSIGVSASASVLPVNIQDWFPLGWTAWISLQSKGLSRVFSNTTVQKYQFSGIQLSL